MPARKVVNYEDGSDARYDTSQMTQVGDGRLTDGTYFYDQNGLPLDAIPGGNEWTPGLPGARGGTGPGGGAVAAGGAGGNMLLASPWFQQAQAAVNAARAADEAYRRQAIEQMLIQFGVVPPGFTDPYGDITQTTRDLAQQNTASGISAAARLKQALADANRDTIQKLTARGLRRSGARGYGLRRNQLGYDQSYSDAVAKLLQGANAAYNSFAQNEYGRQMSLASALQSALNSMSFGGSYNSGGSSAPKTFTPPSYTPSNNPWNDYTGNTIGSGSGGYGTTYGPSAPGQGGGFTSPKHPLLYA